MRLFDRLHRAVALTEAGSEFRRVVQENLESIAIAAERISQPQGPERITVSATIAITSFWLTPRLASFRALHPGLEIHVAISDRLPDMRRESIDVGLRYGDGKWDGLRAKKLFDIDSFPVCSPAYLAQSASLSRPSDLLQHSLINLDGVTHSAEDWTWWLSQHDVDVPTDFRMLGFDSYDNVIQLAIGGQGIALGFSELVNDMLADGRLVQPLRESLTRNYSVFVVTPDDRPMSPSVAAFVAWTLDEAGEQSAN